MERVDVTAARVLRAALDTQPLTDAKVSFAWHVAAGPVLAKSASLTSFSGGTLCVCARTVVWRREVERARPVIVERLKQILGPDVIRWIVVSCEEREEKPAAARAPDRRRSRL